MKTKRGHILLHGTFYGDEAKSKVIEEILNVSNHIGCVVRYQGGDNAGHTQWVKVGESRTPDPNLPEGLEVNNINEIDVKQFSKDDGVYYATFVKKVMHNLCSGVTVPGVKNLAGPGMTLNGERLLEEMGDMKFFLTEDNFKISDNAIVNLSMYSDLENLLTDKSVGTTNKAIGIAYSMKYLRFGIKFGDFVDSNESMNIKPALEKLNSACDKFINPLFKHYGLQELNPSKIIAQEAEIIEQFKDRIVDAEEYLDNIINVEKRAILAEGAQGSRLDIDIGEYPNITCSNTGLAGAYSGMGLGVKFDRIIGIVKAPISSKVGGGIFPTEFCDPELFKDNLEGEELITSDLLKRALADDPLALSTYFRVKAAEYGATTGRPRRVGWVDAVMLRQAMRWNLTTELAVTKFDVVDDWDGELKIATEYDVDGKRTNYVPTRPDTLRIVKPIYGYSVPGWAHQDKVRGATSMDQIPVNAMNYLLTLQNELLVPVRTITTGPNSGEVIHNVDLEN
ncbi:adenylosuccinate synthetase [Candidatus Woesearchaeota archaeon]|mgnify:CR=1 FL=1|jgi:adenylosuccinate synthase|nr:adenylosuccinate synthetase [Candidatus Woesearchaeota archaeon]MBT7367995.1 adenylosuccinate synthetase [Candidatus Woesearchaeota archaeon]